MASLALSLVSLCGGCPGPGGDVVDAVETGGQEVPNAASGAPCQAGQTYQGHACDPGRCATGEECPAGVPTGCLPGSCWCNGTTWACTADCHHDIACVPVADAATAIDAVPGE